MKHVWVARKTINWLFGMSDEVLELETWKVTCQISVMNLVLRRDMFSERDLIKKFKNDFWFMEHS